MTSSSSCDIRRNLIPDAPSSDSQLPGATLGGSEPVLGGLGADESGGRTPLRGCVLRGMPHAMSQDSLSIKYRR